METIVLVFERSGLDFQYLASLISDDSWLSDNAKVLIIGDSGNRYLYVVEVTDPSVEGLFEDWPADMIPVGDFTIFAVDYRSREFVVRVVREIAASADMLVDTNYDEVVRGSQLSDEHLVSRQV